MNVQDSKITDEAKIRNLIDQRAKAVPFYMDGSSRAAIDLKP